MALQQPEPERDARADDSARLRRIRRETRQHLAWRLGLAGVALALAGCSRGARESAKAHTRTAQVAIVNLSDYEWKLTVRTPQGEAVRTVPVAPRARAELAVPAGEFQIEQTVCAADFGPETSRHFTVRLAAGRHYRWPLATLLPTDDEAAATVAKQP